MTTATYKIVIEYGIAWSSGYHPVTVSVYRYGSNCYTTDPQYAHCGKSLQRLLSGAARWIADEEHEEVTA